MEKFIVNKCIKFVYGYQENNSVYIKLYNRLICLKGNGVDNLFMEMIKEFKNPITVEEVISKLSSKYKKLSINKAVQFLLNNSILISYFSEFQQLSSYELNEIMLLSYIHKRNDLNYKKNNIIYVIDEKIDIQLGDEKIIVKLKKFIYEELEIRLFDSIVVLIFNENDVAALTTYSILVKNHVMIIPIVIMEDEINIGPINTGDTGCYLCAKQAYINNLDDERYIFHEVKKQNIFFINNLMIAINIAKQELLKHKQGFNSLLINSLISIDNYNFQITVHPFVKNYECECSGEI